VRATSFDEQHVEKLLASVRKKMSTLPSDDPKYAGYGDVAVLLQTKQELGGSSLTKLKKILELVSDDGVLRNQYLHIGAGQSYRTSGRGVQMQNLKRLGAQVDDLDELDNDDIAWTNTELGRNIRQVFTARDPKGELIVGDFSSIESRMLAYLAGATKKLQAYARGMDLYKVQAADIYHVDYADVTKEQRQTGKVGELSCGYQAGGGAVQAFAAKMGVHMSEAEAADLVTKWRLANPEIVDLWARLDVLLDEGLASSRGWASIGLANGLTAKVVQVETPSSLLAAHPGAQSIEVQIILATGEVYMTRVFHGVYRRGRQLCYYKPDERAGQLWKSFYQDPKTKQRKWYSIYGGKLSGIITQSMARELFFETLQAVDRWVQNTDGVALVGQFHDEIVLDWTPLAGGSVDFVCDVLEGFMTSTHLKGFPLGAEVKHAYRYTK